MTLPVRPPVAPMLAKLSRELPRDAGLFYEPKWDGFRCIVFRDGDDVELGSRNEKPLTRYFPELVDALRRELPDALRARRRDRHRRSRRPGVRRAVPTHPSGGEAHPPARRVDACLVRRLRPAGRGGPLLHGGAVRGATRRAREGPQEGPPARPPHARSPTTPTWRRTGSPASRVPGSTAWWSRTARSTYLPDKRAMLKVKHQRTADCVVAGFRTHKDGAGVGSLLLGLFDGSGTLHHVGVASGFSVARRRELVAELEPYRKDAQKDHPWAGWADAQAAGRAPGGGNRWNAGKDMTWEPLAGRGRRRGLLRPPATGPLPPRNVVRALAPRPRARVVHLRPARHPGPDGAERGLRHLVVAVVSRAGRARPPARRARRPPRSR